MSSPRQPARPPELRKGRGAPSNLQGRFERWGREAFDDGWAHEEQGPSSLKTEVTLVQAKSILTRNASPDLAFDRSINPYQGCEHGCVYCYARPSHAYWGLSPGLDFETKLYAKANAAALLRKELSAPSYRPEVIAIGANTDPYQPVERQLKITRAILEVLRECEHPFGIITKNALIERDIDLLAPMAEKNLVRAFVSVTNLDNSLARRLEPRACAPLRRLEAIRRLSAAGVPVGVMVAPVIPFLTDRFMEQVLEQAREAGATMAGYVLLRLPHEVAPLFKTWLEVHAPRKATHVMRLIHQMRGGRDYDATYGVRHRGTGPFAELIARRFQLACKRLGFNRAQPPLDTSRFRPPKAASQLDLF
ncbi:PA0069 family radical SAM protein [Pelomicrobium sp.]|jgi:DNA repair photolyase|uniref:PA0069 family radical SAM protein n=1 Tax=Pelomicrobium sp. TaxID=2815319 RepID=UPI002FDE1149